MYSFSPMIDTSDVHGGFYFMLFVCIVFCIFIVIDILNDDGMNFWHLVGFAFCILLGYLAYTDSYTPNHPKNEQIVGTFLHYQPEGYRETSGKTRSDKHYMYIVYEVEGNEVILKCDEGVSYPKRAILYRN